jgi:streptogramin lyase
LTRCITALALAHALATSLTLSLCSGHLSAQSAAIIAGTGVGGYSGDGSAATTAQVLVPSSVFATPAGDVYIADTANNRIRHISAAGQIRTIAGTGQRVYSQDDLPAGETGLMSPVSVVTDGAGSVYIAEWTGNRVRKIDPSGKVSTIAGNGESGYVGENLQATETSLWTPSRIFLDGKGNLYIAEWNAHRVRVVRPDGKISTVAGNGKQGFAGDEGPATEASLDRPNGLFVTEQGEIYISDLGNNRVRLVDA